MTPENAIAYERKHPIDLVVRLFRPALVALVAVTLILQADWSQTAANSTMLLMTAIGSLSFLVWSHKHPEPRLKLWRRAIPREPRRITWRKPAWWLLGSSLLLMLSKASTGWLMLSSGLIIVAAGYYVVRAVALWRSTYLVLTDSYFALQHQPPRWTFAPDDELMAMLSLVSTVDPERPVWMRWLLPRSWRCGHLRVDTPGEQDIPLNLIRNVRNPDELRHMILKAKNRASAAREWEAQQVREEQQKQTAYLQEMVEMMRQAQRSRNNP
jgi:hypothetical protein